MRGRSELTSWRAGGRGAQTSAHDYVSVLGQLLPCVRARGTCELCGLRRGPNIVSAFGSAAARFRDLNWQLRRGGSQWVLCGGSLRRDGGTDTRGVICVIACITRLRV